MNKKFFTPLQVAEMLQVEERDVLIWLKKKELGGIKIGTIWRVREDQFDTFIEKNSTDLPAPTEEVVGEDSCVDSRFSPARFPDEFCKQGKQRYTKLYAFLMRRNTSRIRLTFAEIEKIIDRDLPSSARAHRAYWANDPKHSQAKAWLDAGWCSKELDLVEQKVTFVKM